MKFAFVIVLCTELLVSAHNQATAVQPKDAVVPETVIDAPPERIELAAQPQKKAVLTANVPEKKAVATKAKPIDAKIQRGSDLGKQKNKIEGAAPANATAASDNPKKNRVGVWQRFKNSIFGSANKKA